MDDARSAPHRRLLKRAAETPWALRPSVLASIIELLALRAEGKKYTDDDIDDLIGDGPPTQEEEREASVAILPIYGVIVPKATLMTSISGGTSLEIFRESFREALADDDVESIVLDVDSPGGSVDLVEETGDEIFAARGAKPIVAVANTQAASAAYWLASQAEELYVTPSGEVGSIGVWAAHEDISAWMEKEGIDRTLISAGKYKVEGNPFEPLSDEAREEIQRHVDGYYEKFLAAVARGRGVGVEAVRSGFGEGRMVMPDDAVRAGMVDGARTIDDVLTGNAPMEMAEARSLSRIRSPQEFPVPAEVRSGSPGTVLSEIRFGSGPGPMVEARSGRGVRHRFQGRPDPDDLAEVPPLARRLLAMDREPRPSHRRLEIRQEEDGSIAVEGYGAIYDSPYTVYDWFGEYEEEFVGGAFEKTLADGADIRLLINHGGLPLARSKSRTLELESNGTGLRFLAPSLDPSDPDVRALEPKLRRGDVDGASILFRAIRQEWDADFSHRWIVEAQIFDVSIVTFPMNDGAWAGLRGDQLVEMLAEAEPERLLAEARSAPPHKLASFREVLTRLLEEPSRGGRPLDRGARDAARTLSVEQVQRELEVMGLRRR